MSEPKPEKRKRRKSSPPARLVVRDNVPADAQVVLRQEDFRLAGLLFGEAVLRRAAEGRK